MDLPETLDEKWTIDQYVHLHAWLAVLNLCGVTSRRDQLYMLGFGDIGPEPTSHGPKGSKA